MDPMLAAAAADKQHREESMIETGYVIGENEGSLKFRGDRRPFALLGLH